jgi:hypothetical protein
MFCKFILLPVVSILLAVSVPMVNGADQVNPGEVKLRESLRATTLQLRNAEAERASLQAAQAELEAKTKALQEQLDLLTRQAAANQTEADRVTTELKGKIAERDREIGGLRVALDKAGTDNQKIVEYARAKEAQRTKLSEKVISLDHQVADQQRRNLAMYKLGTEILARYEKFGLGTALTAREPFVGITRVKFENLIQDYSDKLADERIKSPQGPQPTAGPQSSVSSTSSGQSFAPGANKRRREQ